MANQLKNCQEMYILTPKFKNLLAKVGAKENAFTLKQVIDYLKSYISQRKLYDPKDPRRVYCESDELGSVFGVNEFTVSDVLKLIYANIAIANPLPKQPDPAGCSLHPSDVNKRKCSDCTDDGAGRHDTSTLKRSRNSNGAGPSTPRPSSPMILFIPTSPVYCSSSETELSIQGYETAVICSPEEDLSSEYEVEAEEYAIEYEVESIESDSIKVSDTDSDIDDIAAVHAVLICRDDSDKDFWADHSSDEFSDSSDSELGEADKWECSRCGKLNKPFSSFCSLCWEQRIGWLPEWQNRRPPHRHRQKKGSRNLSSPPPVPSDQGYQSQLSSLPSSQESVTQESSTEHEPSSSSAPPQKEEKMLGMCLTCLQRPKTASIVHGKTAHQVCCYPCARKLEDKKQPCPVCRRTIQKVVRNFIM